jgi:hypothetical protein
MLTEAELAKLQLAEKKQSRQRQLATLTLFPIEHPQIHERHLQTSEGAYVRPRPRSKPGVWRGEFHN